MRIVTNPGSDIPRALVEHLEIDITPQHILVDGVEHDTRPGIAAETIDEWVRTAAVHPYILGTSAAEFAKYFREFGREDPEILAVMTSKKIIQSYDAALSAGKTLARHSKDVIRVEVVDTGKTSGGAGLATILGAVGRDAGLTLSENRTLVTRFCVGLDMKFCVRHLDYMVKGGRASALRAWLADVLRVRPIIAMKNGEVSVAAKISVNADPVLALADQAEKGLRGRRVWAAVGHGNAPELGRRLANELRARLQPEFIFTAPFSPGIYLNGGPGSVGYSVAPVDRLDFDVVAPAWADGE